MANSGRVTPSQLEDIVTRLQTPTAASRSWDYRYNPQDTHVKFLKERDPNFQPKRIVYENKLDEVVSRLVKPTVASRASEFCFDNQDANLQYLQQVDPKIHPNRSPTPHPSLISPLSPRSPLLSRSSVEDNMPTCRSTSPNRGRSANSPWVPGMERTYLGYRRVSPNKLDQIVDRVSRPTVSSEGGIQYSNRKYEYITETDTKTMPKIKGVENRYTGNKKISEKQLDDMIKRLHSPTKSMLSRSALTPSPHVWEEFQPHYYHTLRKKKHSRSVSSMN